MDEKQILSITKLLAVSSKAFSKEADEVVTSMVENNEMPQTVEACALAARYEMNPRSQQRLLRAAVFGKAYAPGQVDNTLVAATCGQLRTLNQLRKHPEFAELTWPEYEELGPHQVVQRLLVAREHQLAWRIAANLQLPTVQAAITMHWCVSKIREAPAALSDAALLEQLRGKMSFGPASVRPRVADVAEEAHRVGRSRLAVALLDELEPHAAAQVPLLLAMGELSEALVKAVASADSETVLLVLLHARGALAEAELFELLATQPDALELIVAHWRSTAPELLKALYYHVNRPADAAALAIREAYRSGAWSQRIRGMSIAVQFYESTASKLPHLARASQEQLKLLDIQKQLEHDTQGSYHPPGAPRALAARFRFIDTTVNETIYKCFAYGKEAAAELLRAECRVPERRWWQLKLKGLSHARNWPALAELGNARRSPIGFRPFVDACMAQGAHDEAAKYVVKLGPAEQVEMYLKLTRLEDARRVALQHREKKPELLEACLNVARGGLNAQDVRFQ